MSKTIGLQLVVYSILLAGLSYLAYRFAPTLARPTLITGLTGGALCLIWGLRGFTGSRNKSLPLLTLTLGNFFLFSQVVFCWLGGGEEVPGRRAAAALVTLIFVLSMSMMLRIVYFGAVFDGVVLADPTKDAGARPQTSRMPATQTNALKHG
jgi:hypothetical protein